MARLVIAILSRPEIDERSSSFGVSTVSVPSLGTYLQTIGKAIVEELESRNNSDGFPSVLFEKDRSMFFKNFEEMITAVPVYYKVSLSNFNVARLALINRVCGMPGGDATERDFALLFALHYFVLLIDELLIENQKKPKQAFDELLTIDCSISHLRRMEIAPKRENQFLKPFWGAVVKK